MGVCYTRIAAVSVIPREVVAITCQVTFPITTCLMIAAVWGPMFNAIAAVIPCDGIIAFFVALSISDLICFAHVQDSASTKGRVSYVLFKQQPGDVVSLEGAVDESVLIFDLFITHNWVFAVILHHVYNTIPDHFVVFPRVTVVHVAFHHFWVIADSDTTWGFENGEIVRVAWNGGLDNFRCKWSDFVPGRF